MELIIVVNSMLERRATPEEVVSVGVPTGAVTLTIIVYVGIEPVVELAVWKFVMYIVDEEWVERFEDVVTTGLKASTPI